MSEANTIGRYVTIISGGAEHDRNMSGAAVTLRNDELFRVDDAAVLDNISCYCGVILNGLSIHCLQASDLCINGCLIAAQASEYLLTSDGVRLIHSIVRAVSRAIVTVQSKSTATAKVTLGNGTRDQVLTNDSGRAEQSANGSCAGTSTNLRKKISVSTINSMH